jgi:tRNA(Ile)-lysidine synthase
VVPVGLSIWRPLLGIAFDDVRALAAASGLPIAEDPSNLDESFRRNAIRHSVLPMLEQLAPGAIANVARFGELAAVDDDELDAQAGRALESLSAGNDIDRPGLRALPAAIQSRVVRRWITGQAPTGLEVTRERVDAVLGVATTPGPRRFVELGHGTNVEVTRHRLRVVIQPLT